MKSAPHSIIARLVMFAIAVQAVVWALGNAARLLSAAMPVLAITGTVAAVGLVAKRLFWDREHW
jgi:hypothetical protein